MSAESVPSDRLIGQVLASRYEILHRLGEGAMGVVYKARHVKVGRTFAVKVLHKRLLVDPKVAQRFEREAELAGRLRHANVVGVVDVGEVDGMHYMVMDFAEGPDLAHLLVEAPMPPARIIRLVRQMLEGLFHAHEQGLIHRDFKPENVIVERDSHGAELARIVDFGIALLREGGDSVDGEGRLTTNGLVLGTPHYMAPEQAVADPIDHRIDLFALGIVIYEMLSGRLPFDGSGAEVARANLLLDPPRISERVPYLEVDPLLEAFARQLMAKQRNARPANANVARELLDLIDRDRRAAGHLLGVSPDLSERAPAATQQVAPHDRPQSGDGTVSLRPTPQSAADQVRARWIAAGPGELLVPAPAHASAPPDTAPSSAALSVAPAALAPSPVAEAVVPTLPGPPIVFSAAPAPGRDSAIQSEIDRYAAPPRRRAPWIVGGIALAAAGIVTAWVVTRGEPDAARTEPHIAVSSLPTPPTTTIPTTPPTTPVEPPVERVAPPIADPPVSAPSTASKPGDRDPRATITRTPARDARPRTQLARPLDRVPARPAAPPTSKPLEAASTKPLDPPAKPLEAAPAKPLDPAPARPLDPAVDPATGKAVKPARTTPSVSCDAAPPPLAGISPNAVATLYYKVPDALGLLAPDKAQDLWGRFTRYNVQSLMSAAQPERDEGAVALWLILRDARCRRER